MTMQTFRRLRSALLAAVYMSVALVIPGHAYAAVSSSLAAIAGYVFSAKTFTAPTLEVISGVIKTQAVVQVAGKAVTVPASMRFAANAGQFAVSAVRLNPTGLIVGAVATWLLEKGITYASNGFTKPNPDACVSNCLEYAVNSAVSGYANWFPSKAAVAQAENQLVAGKFPGYSAVLTGVTVTYYTNTGAVWANVQIYQRATSTRPATLPLTETDWTAVATAPVPDPVLQEMTQKMPMPVDLPYLDPSISDIPISEPRLDPVTGRKVQDFVRLTPTPTAAEPLKVDQQTFTKDVDTAPGTAAPTVDKTQFPDDYNREKTQLEMRDELQGKGATDMPDQVKRFDDAKTADKTKSDAIEAQIKVEQGSDKSLWFSWVWTPPVGSCTPSESSVHGVGLSLDYCGPVEMIRDIVGWLFAVYGAIEVYGQLFRRTAA